MLRDIGKQVMASEIKSQMIFVEEVFQTTICDYGQMFCIFRSPNTNKNLKTRTIIDEEYGLEIEINTRGRGKLVKAG